MSGWRSKKNIKTIIQDSSPICSVNGRIEVGKRSQRGT